MGFLTGLGKRSLVFRKEITRQEISLVTNGSHEALTAEYLAIIKTLIAMPSPGDALAVQNIRKTLRRLGEAIENLPSQPTENIFVDAGGAEE